MANNSRDQGCGINSYKKIIEMLSCGAELIIGERPDKDVNIDAKDWPILAELTINGERIVVSWEMANNLIEIRAVKLEEIDPENQTMKFKSMVNGERIQFDSNKFLNRKYRKYTRNTKRNRLINS